MKLYHLFVMFALQACACFADVTLNPLFTDHMVLQRNQPVPVYGTASPGEKVTVEFAGQKKEVVVSASGEWQVKLDPMRASDIPQELIVNSSLDTRHLTLSDVLIGDVWLCAGQSNMATEMRLYPTLTDEAEKMTNPLVRMFKFKREGVGSEEPSDEVVIDPPFNDSWQPMTPAMAREFSATASFFGHKLQPLAGIPVGLLYANRGGTAVNQWLPMDFMMTKPELYAPFLGADNPWWREGPKNPELVRAPSRLFNGTIHPLIPFAIRGCIWYQGESDDRYAAIYGEMFSDLITVWRGLWGYDFPFLFVQLAPYDGPALNWDRQNESWAFLREAQDRALALPNTGRAVIIDSGEQLDIHPQNKQPVGERLALLAAKLDNPAVVADSPEFDAFETVGNKIRSTFRHAGSGLTTKRVVMNKNKRLEPGMDPEAFVVEADSLAGFTICGPDKKFVAAQAAIVAPDTVEIWSDQIAEPLAVRYGWANFPLCNLYNQAGLPASPFRTDNFPMPDFQKSPSNQGGGMKKSVLTGALLSAGVLLQAAEIADDFNRADTAYAAEGSSVGSEWVNSEGSSVWKIVRGALFVNTQSAPAILYNKALETESGDGKQFSLSADIAGNLANTWVGLVFNYQDPANYYAVRIKMNTSDYQVLAIIDGATALLLKGKSKANFIPGTTYSVTVASDTVGVFDISIQRAGRTDILNPNQIAQDFSASLKGGYAGVYSPSASAADPDAVYDNFSLVTAKK